jgi:hypothetical protein
MNDPSGTVRLNCGHGHYFDAKEANNLILYNLNHGVPLTCPTCKQPFDSFDRFIPIRHRIDLPQGDRQNLPPLSDIPLSSQHVVVQGKELPLISNGDGGSLAIAAAVPKKRPERDYGNCNFLICKFFSKYFSFYCVF